MQFVKSGLVLFSFGSITVILYFLFLNDNKFLKTIFILSLTLWGMITFGSMISNNIYYYKNTSLEDNSWEQEIVQSFTYIDNNGLLAMRACDTYSGQFISANDVGPWYTSVIKKTGGVSLSTKNWNRQDLLKRLESDTSKTVKRKVIAKLKSEDVKYLIATPENQQFYQQLDSLSLLKKLKNSNWIYELED
mgnify:CR=1 FL=1